MLILGGTDKEKVTTNRDVAMQKYAEWTGRLVQEKRLQSAHKLKDGEGRRLTVDGSDKVTDGPFSETKETVGGYYIIDAENYTEASAVAQDCPVLLYQGGYVEIRAIER